MIKETFSPEETFAFGKWIGEKALPGQVYTLVGDLGVGKTVYPGSGRRTGDHRACKQSYIYHYSGI